MKCIFNNEIVQHFDMFVIIQVVVMEQITPELNETLNHWEGVFRKVIFLHVYMEVV